MNTSEMCSVTIIVPSFMTAMLLWKLEIRQLRWADAGSTVSSRRKRAHPRARPIDMGFLCMA